jgi:hypothetical protein
MTREEFLSLRGDFTWDFGCHFFIETAHGNFIWSDPDYNGDNTIQKTDLTCAEYFGSSFGRCKGAAFIGSRCGYDVVLRFEHES